MWYNGGTGAYVKNAVWGLVSQWLCSTLDAEAEAVAVRYARDPMKLHTTRVAQVAVDRSATSDDAPAAGVYLPATWEIESRRDNCSHSPPVPPKKSIYSQRRQIVLRVGHSLLADH
ncbi:hypothetical protein F4774DRAFT_422927 [Daldinia eschscholtzii]|nr:hypothetical protein F4774DRAFT_422927 [Daldinia eschscholtzii]